MVFAELAAACYLAHRLGKRIYVTVSAFVRESDLPSLPAFLRYLQDIAVDGIILSDPGTLLLARLWAPKIPIHLSTQCNTTNSLSALFWQRQGVHRINLAREITFAELRGIRSRVSIALEVFVHGALCMAYSGRCLLSAVLNRRSSNQGLCTQPCRWSYKLLKEKRPGEYFPIGAFLLARYVLAHTLGPEGKGDATIWPAAMAGGFYAFASSQLFYVSLGQFNIASSHWVPYTILFILKSRRDLVSLRWPALAALFLIMQSWAEMTYATFLLVFIALYIIYEAATYQLANQQISKSANRKSHPTDPRSLIPDSRSPIPNLQFSLRNLLLLSLLFTLGISPLLAVMLPDMRAEGDFWVEGSGFAEVFSADLGHPAVEAIRDPAVIALAELVAEVGVDDRITESREIFPVVAENVAVVERDDVALAASQDVAERHPTPPAFALQPDVDFCVRQ